MTRLLIAACLCLVGVLAWTASRPADIPFEKHTLDLGANESCAVADINGDGKPDIVSGENWYEGPRWTKHKFRSLPYTNNYIDNFSDLPLDVNGDGRIDIVSCSWFAHRLFWSENPGPRHGRVERARDRDGLAGRVRLPGGSRQRRQSSRGAAAVRRYEQPLAWYEAKNGEFVKHVVSPKS